MRVVWRAAATAFLSIVVLHGLGAQPYTFRHYAGTNGGPGRSDGPAADARFSRPSAVAVDSDGNVYVADTDNRVIRRVAPSGEVSTVAGLAGAMDWTDGFGSEARFGHVTGLTVDQNGNVFVSDAGNNVIRKITPGGLVTTFAGAPGVAGHADGTGSAARFHQPEGLASDAAGNIYVADRGSHTIRRITPAGVVTTLAGLAFTPGIADGSGSVARFDTPSGLAIDSSGNVWVADSNNDTIRKITPGGAVSTEIGVARTCGYVDGAVTTARLCHPRDVAFSASGELMIADDGNKRLRKLVLSSSILSTFAGSGAAESVDGVGADASFSGLASIAPDGMGGVFVAEAFGNTIRRAATGAIVTTFAGKAAASGSSTASATAARFNAPEDVAVDGAGNVYIADTYNHTIRRIPAGTLEPVVFAGNTGMAGNLDGTGTFARFAWPAGLAVDGAGNVYVADRHSHSIRKITPGAVVTTLAGGAGSGSEDGSGAAARFFEPQDLAVDASGNVYVADTGNHTIRKVTSAGVVTTVAGMAGYSGALNATGSAARFNQPFSITVGSDGNIYVSDRGNGLIRKVTPAGVVTTLAGAVGSYANVDGNGADARFGQTMGIAADGSGNLYVADGAATIRKVTLGGAVTTVAGTFDRYGTEDGTGGVAAFHYVFGIASTSGGTLFLVDRHTIRRGTPALADRASIDDDTGIVDIPRQLSVSPLSSTSWSWRLVRRPHRSAVVLSSTTSPNPTFTPDIPDLYVFRVVAAVGTQTSISEVSFYGYTGPTLSLGPAALPDATRGLDYTINLTATGGTAPYLFSMAGSLPPGMTLSPSGVLSGRPTTAGSYPIDVEVSDSEGMKGARMYHLVVRAGATAVEAHAATASSVAITWPLVHGASFYRIYRASTVGSWSMIFETGALSYNDLAVATGKAYLYRIAAVDAALHESTPGSADLATTVAFTDPALNPAATPIRAVHISQLRTAVNAVRTLAAIGNATFTNASLAAVPVRAVHVTELRTALAAARSALSLPSISWVDATITPGVTPAKGVHLEQLRNGVR